MNKKRTPVYIPDIPMPKTPPCRVNELEQLIMQVCAEGRQLLVWLPNGHPVFGIVSSWDAEAIRLETRSGTKIVMRAHIACAEIFKEKSDDPN